MSAVLGCRSNSTPTARCQRCSTSGSRRATVERGASRDDHTGRAGRAAMGQACAQGPRSAGVVAPRRRHQSAGRPAPIMRHLIASRMRPTLALSARIRGCPATAFGDTSAVTTPPRTRRYEMRPSLYTAESGKLQVEARPWSSKSCTNATRVAPRLGSCTVHAPYSHCANA